MTKQPVMHLTSRGHESFLNTKFCGKPNYNHFRFFFCSCLALALFCPLFFCLFHFFQLPILSICSIFVLATFSPSVPLVCLSPRFIFNLLYIIFNLHYTTILYYNLFYIIIYFILLCLIYYSIFLLIYSIAFFY